MVGFASVSDVDRIMKKIKEGKKVLIKPVSETEVKQATQQYARNYPRERMIEQLRKQNSTTTQPTKTKVKTKVKSKPKSKFLKSLQKKIPNRRILKKEQPTLTIAEKKVESVFARGSSFFRDEWEAETKEANLFVEDGLFWK